VQLRRGQVAVVTGGASGIGLALCERFAAEGLRVVMADLPGEALDREATRLEAVAVPTDVTSWEECDALAAQAGDVAVLCLNAGVQLPGVTWEFTREQWGWVLGIDLGGVVHGLHAFLPRMVARGTPAHVVATASLGGLLPFRGIAPYTAAKYAVVGLMESLAEDVRAHGAPLGVSVLCPGPVVSSLRENSRVLQPGEHARDIPLLTDVPRMPTSDVADLVVDAISEDRFWILTHPEYNETVRARTESILAGGTVVVPELAR
jgi:NAD(P)-dependent dehydrogenase (short-subunit alcohol dehydrogenase family)